MKLTPAEVEKRLQKSITELEGNIDRYDVKDEHGFVSLVRVKRLKHYKETLESWYYTIDDLRRQL